jgi:hypothetical protein
LAKRIADTTTNVHAGAGQKTIVTNSASSQKFRSNPMARSYAKIGSWIAELLLVFIGVYAAFWLNSFQQHREDAKRRDRILASLERLLEAGITNNKEQAAKQEREVAELQRAIKAGEMPPIRHFTFTTDYSPGDIGTILSPAGLSCSMCER